MSTICGDSSMVEQQLHQADDGGSSPTSPLQISSRPDNGQRV